VTFDAARMKELDAMVRRMGAIVSVFEVRSSTLGNKSFSAFRELMDVYVDLCTRELKQGKDFTAALPQPGSADVERASAALSGSSANAPTSSRRRTDHTSAAPGAAGAAPPSRATSDITQSRNALIFGRSWVLSGYAR